MVDWRKLNVGQRVFVSLDESGRMPKCSCVVKVLFKDYAVAECDDLYFWIDDSSAKMFDYGDNSLAKKESD